MESVSFIISYMIKSSRADKLEGNLTAPVATKSKRNQAGAIQKNITSKTFFPEERADFSVCSFIHSPASRSTRSVLPSVFPTEFDSTASKTLFSAGSLHKYETKLNEHKKPQNTYQKWGFSLCYWPYIIKSFDNLGITKTWDYIGLECLKPIFHINKRWLKGINEACGVCLVPAGSWSR